MNETNDIFLSTWNRLKLSDDTYNQSEAIIFNPFHITNLNRSYPTYIAQYFNIFETCIEQISWKISELSVST